jgi:cell division protein FtsB
MTTLGKILAIVNLVLSLVVGAFIVMSYVARTNWHAAYNKVNEQLKVAQADANGYKDESAIAQKVISGLKDELKAMDQQVKKAKIDADRALVTERARLEAESKKTNELTSNQGGQIAELERRLAEVKYLHATLDQRNKELTDKEKDVQTFRDRAVEMEITAKRTQEMNERLLVQLETMNKALKSADASIANKPLREGATRVNPPTEEVAGTIKETDAQSGLVTINVGTDRGVKEGNTLDVFRLKPEAAYLGTIVILSARPNEAVGRPTSKGRIPLQVGDKVASNVMSKRYGDQGNQGIR